MQKIRVGVLGVGHLGRYHALNYAQMHEVDLIGVFDIDKNKAEEIARESGCRAFKNVDSLITQSNAISIAVPTDRHYPVGKKVLEKGVHCLMEKPIAQNLEEADQLIHLAHKKGVVFHVGHVERFNPAFRALTRYKLKPQFIESHRLAPFNPRGTEVSVILDLMIHDIDIILSLVKEPIKNIDASGVAVVSHSIDIANARMHFKNGCVANITASRISQKKMRKMRIFQKNTYIAIDFLQKTSEIYQLSAKKRQKGKTILGEMGKGPKKRYVIYQSLKGSKEEGLLCELKTFIKSIKGEHLPAVTAEAGREALAIANQILNRMEK